MNTVTAKKEFSKFINMQVIAKVNIFNSKTGYCDIVEKVVGKVIDFEGDIWLETELGDFTDEDILEVTPI